MSSSTQTTTLKQNLDKWTAAACHCRRGAVHKKNQFTTGHQKHDQEKTRYWAEPTKAVTADRLQGITKRIRAENKIGLTPKLLAGRYGCIRLRAQNLTDAYAMEGHMKQFARRTGSAMCYIRGICGEQLKSVILLNVLYVCPVENRLSCMLC